MGRIKVVLRVCSKENSIVFHVNWLRGGYCRFLRQCKVSALKQGTRGGKTISTKSGEHVSTGDAEAVPTGSGEAVSSAKISYQNVGTQ